MTLVISLRDSDAVRCFTEWFGPVLRYGDHPLKTDAGQQVVVENVESYIIKSNIKKLNSCRLK